MKPGVAAYSAADGGTRFLQAARNPMAQFDLTLNQQQNQSPPPPPRGSQRPPVLGGLAVAFAVLGIVTISIPFVPLAFVFSILALLFGQLGWGVAGLCLSIFGVITSPVLMALIGLGAFVWLIDWLPVVQPTPSPPSGPTIPT